MAETANDEIQKKSSVQVRLAYKVFEPETGADTRLYPVIFLHGITSCKETWDGIALLLANATKRKAYCYDARNHGDSDWTEEFTLDDLVLDLVNFMESNCIPKAILIGHSLGGTVSINFALQAPEKVEMVVIEEMFVRKPQAALYSIPLAFVSLAPIAVKTIPSDADEETASKIIMNFVFKDFPPQFSAMAHYKIDKSTMALKRTEDGRFTLKSNMPVIEKSLRESMEGESLETEVQGIYDGPACFVYGELSYFQVCKDVDNIRKYFPKAEFTEIKKARHTVHSDCPEAYIDTILKFISKNSTFKVKL